MKKLIFALCLLTFSMGMMAQEEKPKSNWVTGEQESSFPGQMIKYAVCLSPTVIKGQKGDITVSLNIMEFRDNTNYFFKSTGEDFKVDYNVTQRVLLQFDDDSENFYALEGSNNHTSNTLKFPGSYQNKFKKLLKKGKKLKVEVEFADAGTHTIEFNVEGLDPSYIK